MKAPKGFLYNNNLKNNYILSCIECNLEYYLEQNETINN